IGNRPASECAHSSWLGIRSKRIARAAPAFRVPHQNAAFDECQNVAQRCVLGTLGKLRVFRGRELARETIEKTVEQETLTGVERDPSDGFPEARFGQDSTQNVW